MTKPRNRDLRTIFPSYGLWDGASIVIQLSSVVADLNAWEAVERFGDDHMPIQGGNEQCMYSQEEIDRMLARLQEDWNDDRLREFGVLAPYLERSWQRHGAKECGRGISLTGGEIKEMTDLIFPLIEFGRANNTKYAPEVYHGVKTLKEGEFGVFEDNFTI